MFFKLIFYLQSTIYRNIMSSMNMYGITAVGLLWRRIIYLFAGYINTVEWRKKGSYWEIGEIKEIKC